MDPEKASLFIIPYDIGLDGYLDARTCNNRRQCTPGLVGKLTDILSKSRYFQRHNGGDHAVLWSLGQYHPWPRAGCDVFMKDFCEKCTFTCYWMDPTKPDNKFVSVPFPSGYHYWDGRKNFPWKVSDDPNPRSAVVAGDRVYLRNYTAVYLGSTQTLNPAHTKIRRAMTAQCNMSSECHWLQISHNSKDNNIADFLSIYRKAIFCLCPPGDDPARKAVFDAIVSGCISVIFEVATLYNQYPWHIGEQDALDISVNIPGGQVRSGKLDFMSVLLSISPDLIKKKQLALARVAPRVQYAIPPYESLLNRYETAVWDPPFPDGVEILLDGLHARMQRVVRNESTQIPPRMQTGREWAQEYDRVRVQVPKDQIPQKPAGAPDAAAGDGVIPAATVSGIAINSTESDLQAEQDKLLPQGVHSLANAAGSGGGGGQQHHQQSGGHHNRHGKGGGKHHGQPGMHHGKGGKHHLPPPMAAPGDEENAALEEAN